MSSHLLPVFDAHLHIIDPGFPIEENNGFTPPIYVAPDYVTEVEAVLQAGGFKLRRGVCVAGSWNAARKQDWMGEALGTLAAELTHQPGEDSSGLERANSNEQEERFLAVGVAQIDDRTCDAEIRELTELGVRALRFNLHRGKPGIEQSFAEYIAPLAERAFRQGKWHAEFYVDSVLFSDPAKREEFLALACDKLSIDHMGLSAEGFSSGLLPLLSECKSHGKKLFVKATGFSRWHGTREQLRTALVLLLREYPLSLVFGTDLPCTRAAQRFSKDDVDFLDGCIREATEEGSFAALRHRVYWSNAVELYR